MVVIKMGRINRLNARSVATAAAGYHCDGGGLYLLVTATGAASWVLRFRMGGKAREMGRKLIALTISGGRVSYAA